MKLPLYTSTIAKSATTLTSNAFVDTECFCNVSSSNDSGSSTGRRPLQPLLSTTKMASDGRDNPHANNRSLSATGHGECGNSSRCPALRKFFKNHCKSLASMPGSHACPYVQWFKQHVRKLTIWTVEIVHGLQDPSSNLDGMAKCWPRGPKMFSSWAPANPHVMAANVRVGVRWRKAKKYWTPMNSGIIWWEANPAKCRDLCLMLGSCDFLISLDHCFFTKYAGSNQKPFNARQENGNPFHLVAWCLNFLIWSHLYNFHGLIVQDLCSWAGMTNCHPMAREADAWGALIC